MAQYGVRAAEVERRPDGRLVASPTFVRPRPKCARLSPHAIALFEAD
jgi:hypothetical protein